LAVDGLKVMEKEDQSTRGERGREVCREGARRIGTEPWERQSRRREGGIGLVRSTRQKVAKAMEDVMTSPGLAPSNVILLWDTESRCGLEDVGGEGGRVDREATDRSKPGRTCDIAAVARMASPVGGGVAGGIREKTRWLRPLFHNG